VQSSSAVIDFMRVRGSFIRLFAITACFVAGVLLAASVASGGSAADTTTAATTATAERTAPVTETTTPAIGSTTTEVATTTVEQTTTQRIIVPAPTTTSESSSTDETPAWVWVLLGVAVVGLIAAIAVIVGRSEHHGGPSAAERHRRLDGAIASWIAQGWAVESQTDETAVLRRGSEQLLVGVDAAGHVSTRGLGSDAP
jgi:hypothetical protein